MNYEASARHHSPPPLVGPEHENPGLTPGFLLASLLSFCRRRRSRHSVQQALLWRCLALLKFRHQLNEASRNGLCRHVVVVFELPPDRCSELFHGVVFL